MMFPAAIKTFGSIEAWMNDKRNVIRFLLARLLLMTAMVLTFSLFYLTQS
jgi:hypothetical protein